MAAAASLSRQRPNRLRGVRAQAPAKEPPRWGPPHPVPAPPRTGGCSPSRAPACPAPRDATFFVSSSPCPRARHSNTPVPVSRCPVPRARLSTLLPHPMHGFPCPALETLHRRTLLGSYPPMPGSPPPVSAGRSGQCRAGPGTRRPQRAGRARRLAPHSAPVGPHRGRPVLSSPGQRDRPPPHPVTRL